MTTPSLPNSHLSSLARLLTCYGRGELRASSPPATPSPDPYLLGSYSTPPTTLSWRARVAPRNATQRGPGRAPLPHPARRPRAQAECDAAWSGEGAPAPPGTQTASPSGMRRSVVRGGRPCPTRHTDREPSAVEQQTSFRGRRSASRRPAPTRWTRRARAGATLRAAAGARASGPSPRAWRARPTGHASPRSGTPP